MNSKAHMTAAEMLYAARTNSRKPRELGVIAKKLCIREDFLEALETGNYNVLSENVYILGFARNYAIELGLDPVIIARKLKEELGITPPPAPVEAPAAPISAPARPTDANAPLATPATPVAAPIACATPTNLHPESAANKVAQSAFSSGRILNKRSGGVIIAIAVLIVAIVVIAIASSSSDDIKPVAAPMQEVVEPLANGEIQFNIPAKFEYAVENKETARVAIQAISETWLKIERGGEIVFSRVLMPGDVFYAANKPGARATIGNAGGLDIWVDGNLAPKLGAMHTRVTNVSLDADALGGAAKPTPAPDAAE